MVRVREDEWAAFVKSGALGSLRRLVAPAGTNRPPWTFWSSRQRDELRDACRSRGVSLAVGSVSDDLDEE